MVGLRGQPFGMLSHIPRCSAVAGLPAGQHTVKISLVDADHNVFPGQAVMLAFTVPDHDEMKHRSHDKMSHAETASK